MAKIEYWQSWDLYNDLYLYDKLNWIYEWKLIFLNKIIGYEFITFTQLV